MKPNPSLAIQRRDFLKLAAATTAATLSDHAFAAASSANIAVLIDADDAHAASAPAKWAAAQLQKAATERGATATVTSAPATQPSTRNTSGATLFILVAGAKSPLARDFPHPTSAIDTPDSFRIAPGHLDKVPALLITANDTRGFVYGLLELAERVRYAQDPATALHLAQPIEERPANTVRSVMRCFCSEIEDKPWFYDKDAWRSYLDTLAAARFNRFNLSFGLAYDFPRDVTDDYFHLPYPYLVDVPGYNVRAVRIANNKGPQPATPLPAAEREKNLEALRFIAAETAARGLQFQLGLWTHAYAWTDSPRAYHRIEGLTPETHAAYCRDALNIILKTCPEISGLTMRVHNESGIAEGSYPFWKTLFEAITANAKNGRTIELDMHAKGVNQTMIDIGVATGMHVKLGAKYSAEHQSLGYQQADIRKQEMPPADISAEDVAKMTLAARSFTRYGYADFFQQGSTQLLFRLWPGTQRHLLSGDPALAAAFGRTSSFCGAAGLELMEPLTFKGRDGSGAPAAAAPTPTPPSPPPPATGRNSSTTTASGAATSTTPTPTPSPTAATSAPPSAAAPLPPPKPPPKPPSPTPPASCPSSPPPISPPPPTAPSGSSSPPTCPSFSAASHPPTATPPHPKSSPPSAPSTRSSSPPSPTTSPISSPPAPTRNTPPSK